MKTEVVKKEFISAQMGWEYFLSLPRMDKPSDINADRTASDLGNRLRALKDAALGYVGTDDLDKVPLSFLARELDVVLDDLIRGTTARLGYEPNAKMASNLRSSVRHLRLAMPELLAVPGVAPQAALKLRTVEKGRYQQGFRLDQWPPGLRAELDAMREAYTNPDYAGPGHHYLVTRTVRPVSFRHFTICLNRLVDFLIREKGFAEITLLDMVDTARFLEFRQWYFKQVVRGGHAFFRQMCTGLAKTAAYLAATGQLDTTFELTSTHPEAPWSQFIRLGRKKLQEGRAHKQYAEMEAIPLRTPAELAALASKLRTLPPRTTDGRAPSMRQMHRRRFAAVFYGLGVYVPLRGRNWRELRWDDHLREEKPGEWWVEISGADLKNGTHGDHIRIYRVKLPPGAVSWLLWWQDQLRVFVGEDYRATSPYVFPMQSTLTNDQGRYRWVQMSHKFLVQCVDDATLEVLGQRFRPHVLRHCVATHIVSTGRIEDAMQAATLLGDTLSTVLKFYFKPNEQKALDDGYYAELG